VEVARNLRGHCKHLRHDLARAFTRSVSTYGWSISTTIGKRVGWYFRSKSPASNFSASWRKRSAAFSVTGSRPRSICEMSVLE
jgi:hypothetical protein